MIGLLIQGGDRLAICEGADPTQLPAASPAGTVKMGKLFPGQAPRSQTRSASITLNGSCSHASCRSQTESRNRTVSRSAWVRRSSAQAFRISGSHGSMPEAFCIDGNVRASAVIRSAGSPGSSIWVISILRVLGGTAQRWLFLVFFFDLRLMACEDRTAGPAKAKPGWRSRRGSRAPAVKLAALARFLGSYLASSMQSHRPPVGLLCE